ncbi:MAG: O-antigen ligase family protein [Rhodocyclales bacterium]|nr:O-antigen ligase family protein [Rhodocyclales bacterium]
MMPVTRSGLWQTWLVAVVFIFPIPHTIALRNLLILVGLIALLWTGRKLLPKPVALLAPGAAWLLVLSLWIVFHSVAVSPTPYPSLDQFRANWMGPLLLSALAAWAAAQIAPERAMRTVVIALAAHLIWLLGWQLNSVLTIGARPFEVTPFGSYDFHGTLNSFFLALLLADRLAFAIGRHSSLGLGQHWIWAMLALSLVSDIVLRSRNSTMISVALLVASSLVFFSARGRAWWKMAIAIVIALLLGVVAFSMDSRWKGFRESAAIGWTSDSPYWMTGNDAFRPPTSSGAALEESAYLRAAMARHSINFVADNPLGIGFGHDAFGRAIALKFGHAGMGSSHSGWLDFALAVGIPGLALLLVTGALAVRGGWRQFREHEDAAGLMFCFLVGSYLLRCLLDGHLSGWRLGLFAFICGVLIAAMKHPPRPA